MSAKHAIAILALGVLAGCAPDNSVSPSAPAEDGRRLQVFIDQGTGCHYVGSYKFGLYPRLNPDGTQVCTQKGPGNG